MANKSLIFGGIGVFLLLIVVLFGPYFPFVENPPMGNTLWVDDNGNVIKLPYPPSTEYPLGSDRDGRDMLSLLVLGAKYTILYVLIIAIIRYIIAIPFAYIASRVKLFLNILHLWNGFFSTLPVVFIAIILINNPLVVASPYRTLLVILIIAVIEVGRVSIVLYTQLDELSKTQFVEAGIMVGNSHSGLLRRYYKPFMMPHIIVIFLLDVGRVMLIVGQLAFLEIFLSQVWILTDAPTNTSITWLSILSENRHYIRTDPLVLLFPGAAIVLTIISFNLLGEGLRIYFENKGKSKYNAKLEKAYCEEINVAR